MTQPGQKIPETLDSVAEASNGRNRTGYLISRACPRCRTGYLQQMRDIYGSYIQCISCGHSIDNQSIPKTGEIPKAQPATQTRKTHEFNFMRKLPEPRHWQRVIHHATRRYNKPQSCLWPECEKCKTSETNHKCCIINSTSDILCAMHQKAYIQAFDMKPPKWADMSLPVPYGIISITYFVERVGNPRDRQKAWTTAAHWNHNNPVSAIIHKQIKKLFLDETGLRLEWLEDALETSESQNGRLAERPL